MLATRRQDLATGFVVRARQNLQGVPPRPGPDQVDARRCFQKGCLSESISVVGKLTGTRRRAERETAGSPFSAKTWVSVRWVWCISMYASYVLGRLNRGARLRRCSVPMDRHAADCQCRQCRGGSAADGRVHFQCEVQCVGRIPWVGCRARRPSLSAPDAMKAGPETAH